MIPLVKICSRKKKQYLQIYWVGEIAYLKRVNILWLKVVLAKKIWLMRIFCHAIIYAAPRDEHVSIIFCVNCSQASHVDQCNKRYLNTNDQETLNILRNSVTFFFLIWNYNCHHLIVALFIDLWMIHLPFTVELLVNQGQHVFCSLPFITSCKLYISCKLTQHLPFFSNETS